MDAVDASDSGRSPGRPQQGSCKDLRLDCWRVGISPCSFTADAHLESSTINCDLYSSQRAKSRKVKVGSGRSQAATNMGNSKSEPQIPQRNNSQVAVGRFGLWGFLGERP